MAMESACSLHMGRERFDGKVRMEADHIDFSGPTKYRFRISEISHPRRSDDTLHYNFHGNPVSIRLSSLRAAEKWIEYIQNPQTLADKLGIRDGLAVRVLNLDENHVRGIAGGRSARFISNPEDRCDLVMLGVDRSSELQQLGDLTEYLADDGAIWVILPKSVRTVTKQTVDAATREAGLKNIETIDYSETQSAFKIVRPATARTLTKNGNGAHNGAPSRRKPALRT